MSLFKEYFCSCCKELIIDKPCKVEGRILCESCAMTSSMVVDEQTLEDLEKQGVF